MDEDYDKDMTQPFTEVIEDDQEAVVFQKVHFERIPKEDIVPTTAELEDWGMFDPGRYRKPELQRMVHQFLEEMDLQRFQQRIRQVKTQRFIRN